MQAREIWRVQLVARPGACDRVPRVQLPPSRWEGGLHVERVKHSNARLCLARSHALRSCVAGS